MLLGSSGVTVIDTWKRIRAEETVIMRRITYDCYFPGDGDNNIRAINDIQYVHERILLRPLFIPKYDKGHLDSFDGSKTCVQLADDLQSLTVLGRGEHDHILNPGEKTSVNNLQGYIRSPVRPHPDQQGQPTRVVSWHTIECQRLPRSKRQHRYRTSSTSRQRMSAPFCE